MSDELTRRQILRRLAGVIPLAAAGCATLGPRPRPRPNLVFVLVDDLAWDAVAFMGRYPFLETPNIDRLAREGARFTNAFVTTSLCSPSRASFLTGCYAHRQGVRRNERRDLPPQVPTFPQALQRAGYDTAFVGKWHMRPAPEPRPGFNYWFGFRGQGHYENPAVNENGREFTMEGYMTDILTDRAVRWLKQPRQAPFCLLLWHKAVHGPFTPALRHRNAYADAELPKPPSFEDDFEDKPKWLRRGVHYGARLQAWEKSEGKSVPESIQPQPWDGRNPIHLNYFRSLLAVDESLGHVLAALQQVGELGNTCVLFSSDNGFFLGEHRRGDKRLMYEESIRIPLLVRYPPLARPGMAIEPMVLNLDVAPTLLDLAGVRAPKTAQGRSFLPLLRGEAVNWRKSFLYEYFREGWLPGIPTILGVRTQQWKYIHYPELPEDIDELYDLHEDPHEMRNLAPDPASAEALAHMKTELARLLKETDYTDELPPVYDNTRHQLVLHYTFSRTENGKARDESGKGHDGVVRGPHTARTSHRMGLVLDGKTVVAIEPAPDSLSPDGKPFTVGGWGRPSYPDGVFVSFGGQSHGFALYLRHGIPHFALRSAGEMTVVNGSDAIRPDQRVHLAAILTGDLHVRLFVNGRCVGERKAPDFIPVKPNEGLLVGADLGTPVGDYLQPMFWQGLVEEVRVYWGELSEKALRRWAALPKGARGVPLNGSTRICHNRA